MDFDLYLFCEFCNVRNEMDDYYYLCEDCDPFMYDAYEDEDLDSVQDYLEDKYDR